MAFLQTMHLAAGLVLGFAGGMKQRILSIALAAAFLLISGMRSFAAAPPDLTKAPQAKTDKGYNLGPTGAQGWMFVEGGMTEHSRQILVTVVEKGAPADGVLQVGDVILGVFGKSYEDRWL